MKKYNEDITFLNVNNIHEWQLNKYISQDLCDNFGTPSIDLFHLSLMVGSIIQLLETTARSRILWCIPVKLGKVLPFSQVSTIGIYC